MNTNQETQPRAVLLDSINPAAHEIFSDAGYQVDLFSKGIQLDELAERLEGATVLGVRSGPQVPAGVVKASETLRAIGCYCAGTDHVNQQATNERGIPIFNSHDNSRSVAELVIGSTFSLLRRIQEHNTNLHDGNWSKTEERSYEVGGKTMGVIGYGNVGQHVGELAQAVGMNVVSYDIQERPDNGSRQVDELAELLSVSDVVSVHVPGGQGRPVIGEQELSIMRDGAYLINAARSESIDYDAVDRALREGKIGGAALDVFPGEPAKKGDGFTSVFQGNPRVILTPHIGGSTIEAQQRAAQNVTAKLIRFVQTGDINGVVNRPNIEYSIAA